MLSIDKDNLIFREEMDTMRRLSKFLLGVCSSFMVVSLLTIGSFAYTETRTSAEFEHGGGLGSYCSMTTTVNVTPGSHTSLVDYSFNKKASLGYSFTTSAPVRYHYDRYDNYISQNQLKFMGSTTWDFSLVTTHNF